MKRYFYPAVFHPEEVGGYSIDVPDFDGCVTEGDTMDESYEMAAEAISLCAEYMLDNGGKLPIPSKLVSSQHASTDIIVLVQYDPDEYYRKHNSKSVKKTLTIPSWLNEAAEESNLNFSKILQEALRDRLGIV